MSGLDMPLSGKREGAPSGALSVIAAQAAALVFFITSTFHQPQGPEENAP